VGGDRQRELAGIVLAGGASSRMGTPKALLDWHGTSLLRRVVGILARVAWPVVVVHAPGQELPALPDAVELACDETPGRGPLEGIAAGLRAVRGRAAAAYVSSTDVPLLHPAFVRRVAAALDGCDVVLPVAGGHEHPLSAAYRVELVGRVEELLASERLRPAFLFERVRVRRLEEDELVHPESVRNVNTPEDYREALAEPLPSVTIEAHGTLRRTLGFSRRRLRAATLGAALAGLPALDHALVALNGEHLHADPSLPLIEGDTLVLLAAEAEAAGGAALGEHA
jgi:molybdopterin-guanine dinucleotide biosynthesis protein A